jgi:hypothetical protein
MENNMTTNDTRRGGIIDKDNAHLTERSNRCLVSNCYRMAVTEREEGKVRLMLPRL